MKNNLFMIVAVFSVMIMAFGAVFVSADTSQTDKVKSKTMDKKGPLEKITFIHYKKDKNNAKPDGKGKGNGKGGASGTSDCYGFLAKDAKWKTTEGYIINPANDDGMDAATILSVFETSVNTWDSKTSTNIFGSGVLGSNIADFSIMDGKNVVMFDYLSDNNVIAVTNIWGYFSGAPRFRELVEWDMKFNDAFLWGDSDLNFTVMDFQNIATHELGHSLGLGDLYTTECNTQTMYGYSGYGDIEKRSIDSGDVAGIVKLYGA